MTIRLVVTSGVADDTNGLREGVLEGAEPVEEEKGSRSPALEESMAGSTELLGGMGVAGSMILLRGMRGEGVAADTMGMREGDGSSPLPIPDPVMCSN